MDRRAFTTAVASALALSSTAPAFGQGVQDPTKNLESPFPIGTGMTFSFSASGGGGGSGGSAALGITRPIGTGGFLIGAALVGATSGSAAGSGATASTSPHPNGALKFGLGYDSFFNMGRASTRKDPGQLLVAEA